MDLQQHRIQEDGTCRVDSICGCNVGDKVDHDDTADTISNSKNMDNIETEGTGTVICIVRAYDNRVSHQSKTDDLDLVKIPKALIQPLEE